MRTASLRLASRYALPLAFLLGPRADGIVFPSNVRVNDPAADTTAHDTQSECSIARLGASTLLAAFVDSGSYAVDTSKFTGYSRSTDNGATWTDLGTLPSSAFGDGGTPRISRNPVSGVFLTAQGLSANSVPIFRSTDGGVTFGAPSNAAPGSTFANFPRVVSDDNAASPFYGRLYVTYTEFGGGSGVVKLSRSVDGGVTWSPSGGTAMGPPGTQGTSLVVLPGVSGNLAAFFFQEGGPASIQEARSTDGGVTFSTPATVTTLSTTGSNGDLGLPFSTNATPHAAANPANGHIYVVYDDNSSDQSDVFFRRSTDGGLTWSAGLKLNDDFTTHAQFHPAISVTPDGAHFLVAWYDARDDLLGNSVAYWGVRGTVVAGDLSFGANFPISNAAFLPVYGVDSVVNPKFFTNYEEIAADDFGFDVVWTDGRDDATFAGAMRKNVNVRYTRVTSSSLRGDTNGDGVRDVLDVFYLINALFAGGPHAVSLCHGDANHDGVVDVADVFYLINFLFAGGPAPLPAC